jgi:hypothetical protein
MSSNQFPFLDVEHPTACGVESTPRMTRISYFALRTTVLGVAALYAIAAGLTLSAQSGNDVAPLSCWWKTNKDAVLIGEQFTLILTCGVLETGTSRVVVDEGQFAAGAMTISPFEVVGETTRKDIQMPPWRYFQYEYTARLLKDGFFGEDIDIPPMRITYTAEALPSGEALGSAQQLQLPSLSLRLLSIVPKNTKDISDNASETFGNVERLFSMSRAALVGAGLTFAFALVFLGLAVQQGSRRYRQGLEDKPVPLTAPGMLQACLRKAEAFKVAGGTWTDESAGEALALIRLMAAIGAGYRVAQRSQKPGASITKAETGQIVIASGFLGRTHHIVSAHVTPETIRRRRLVNDSGTSDESKWMETLEQSLHVFSAVRYGKEGHCSDGELDQALINGINAFRQFASRRKKPFWQAPFAWLKAR